MYIILECLCLNLPATCCLRSLICLLMSLKSILDWLDNQLYCIFLYVIQNAVRWQPVTYRSQYLESYISKNWCKLYYQYLQTKAQEDSNWTVFVCINAKCNFLDYTYCRDFPCSCMYIFICDIRGWGLQCAISLDLILERWHLLGVTPEQNFDYYCKVNLEFKMHQLHFLHPCTDYKNYLGIKYWNP